MRGWAVVERLSSIDSTNEEMHRRAAQGAVEGTVLIAEVQTAGRGRQGRAWWAPPGGLWMSILFRRQAVAGLQLVVAASLCSALSRWEAPLQVRWPNDLVCHGKKLGGVLAEVRTQASGGYCVLGLGVNVSCELATFPPELASQSTTLVAESTATPTLAQAEQAVLSALSEDLDVFFKEGLAPFLSRLEAASEVKGREVLLHYAEGPVRGVVAGFAANGGLLLADGSLHLAPSRLELVPTLPHL